MLRIRDRHDREMLYGPTNEELITDIFRSAAKSYRDVPKLLYHIQWKFRDEVRPRFGVMRGREFLMKDAYSFDIDYAGARRSYNKMFVSYLRTFARMGLKAIPMQAESGPIGGNLSHEFIILAETGESAVFCHKDWLKRDVLTEFLDFEGDLQPVVDFAPRSMRRRTRSTIPASARQKTWLRRAASRWVTSFTLATNIRNRWAHLWRNPMASRFRWRWAPTASASRDWLEP